MSMKRSSDTIGNRTRGLPECSAVPQPLRHRVTSATATTNDNNNDNDNNNHFVEHISAREASHFSDSQAIPLQ
jgi:hypothetical protein